MKTTGGVLQDVMHERNRQDAKWGGSENDDQWTALDWHEMIADYNAWARRMAAMGSLDKARNRYIQVAALAVAAVEAIDRKKYASTVAPSRPEDGGVRTMKLIYIGDHFYMESGTVMSRIYTEDGMRSDWGFVNQALRNGESVEIRQATQQERDFYEARLSELKREREQSA